MNKSEYIPPDSKKTDKTFLCQQFSSDFKKVDTYGKLGSLSRGLQNIIHLSSFPTKLWRFPRGMSEWAARGAKKPNFCCHGHSFSSINNPETVLEISTVPEYSGTIFICLLRKIKKNGFLVNILSFLTIMKFTFFIFLNKRIEIIPKYSGTADISKTVSGLLIGEKLWS